MKIVVKRAPTLILVTFLISGLFGAPDVLGEEPAVLNWEDCVKETRQNSPDLAVARERLVQSQLDHVITRSALLPNVTSYVDASGVKAENFNRVDAYSYGVSGSQLLFDGLKAVHDLSSSSAAVRSAQHSYDNSSAGVRLRLRVAFIELLRAQGFIVLTETIATRRRENLKLVEEHHENGKEQESSVLSYKASLEQAEFEMAQAKRRITLSRRQLVKELGRKELVSLGVMGDFVSKDLYSEAPDFQYLTDDTPQYKVLVDNRNAAEHQVRAAYADLMPKVYANASLDKSGERWPPETDSWTAGVNLSFPLFEGGSRWARISKARSSLAQQEAQERSSRDGLVTTIEQAWNNLQDSLGALKVQQSVYEAAEGRSKDAQEKYKKGHISFNDWAVIENDFVNASKTLLDARANAAFTEANWVHAKGWTLEDTR